MKLTKAKLKQIIKEEIEGMNPQEWWDEYGKSKYINFSLDGTSIKPTGSDLDKPQLWKQIHWRWYFANEERERRLRAADLKAAKEILKTRAGGYSGTALPGGKRIK